MRFCDNCKYLNRRGRNIVKNADLAHAKAILRLGQASETLDSASAGLLGFMTQVLFNGILNLGSQMCLESLQILCCFWSQHDLIAHYGQIIARS